MRKLALIVVVGLLIALIAAAVLGLPVLTVGLGYLLGAGWMVGVSVVMNTANGPVINPGEYGDELSWMGAGNVEGFGLHDEGNAR